VRLIQRMVIVPSRTWLHIGTLPEALISSDLNFGQCGTMTSVISTRKERQDSSYVAASMLTMLILNCCEGNQEN
jgi:hypothetical protein